MLADLTSKISEQLLAGQQAIFRDLGWQYQAYKEKGLDAIDEVFFRDHPLNGHASAYQGWLKITAGGAVNKYDGNVMLLNIEQKYVAASFYDRIVALNPISAIAISLGVPPALLGPLPSLIGEVMGFMTTNLLCLNPQHNSRP